MDEKGRTEKNGVTLEPTAPPQVSPECHGPDSHSNLNSRPKEQHLCNHHVWVGAQEPCQTELRKRHETSSPSQSSAHLHVLFSPAKFYICFYSWVQRFPSNHILFKWAANAFWDGSPPLCVYRVTSAQMETARKTNPQHADRKYEVSQANPRPQSSADTYKILIAPIHGKVPQGNWHSPHNLVGVGLEQLHKHWQASLLPHGGTDVCGPLLRTKGERRNKAPWVRIPVLSLPRHVFQYCH